MRLAEELWTADGAVCRAEDKLFDLLEGFDGWSDWSRDSYDCSLELYGCPPDARLPESVATALGEAGFDVVWLNHIDGWETTYHGAQMARRTTDGHRVKTESSTEVILRRRLAELGSKV